MARNRHYHGLRAFLAGKVIRDSALAAATQAIAQVVRFGTNVVLAGLLSPAIFGVLALVTTVRTGVELLTDVGINQSIIVSKDGSRQPFVETAWGLQILRGLVLAAIGALAAYPIGYAYGEEHLGFLLLVGSIGSIISGLGRPGPALLQKERQVGKLALFRLGVAVSSAAITIAFASVMPSALGVVLGGLVALVVATALSFLVHPLPHYVPRLDKEYRDKILNFGKWIFLSSIIFFFAQNFDRLFLPANIPLAVFGIYGISRSIADVVVQTVNQINQLVVLPAVAQAAEELPGKRRKIARTRFAGLTVISAGIGVLIASADLIVLTIFDARYALGATILPILLLGSWFAIHASVNESVLMGLGKTKAIAAGNATRLVTAVLGLPIAFALGGLPAGLAVIALLDLPRYLFLLWAAARVRMAFAPQDAVAFAVMLGTAVLLREAFVGAGIVDGMISAAQSGGLAQLLTYR